MKKETSFLIVSIFWMLIFNIVVLNFFLGKGILSTNLLVGAVVVEPEETAFIPGSVLKIAAPLLILNFIILVFLVIAYEKWVKERNIKDLV